LISKLTTWDDRDRTIKQGLGSSTTKLPGKLQRLLWKWLMRRVSGMFVPMAAQSMQTKDMDWTLSKHTQAERLSWCDHQEEQYERKESR